MSTDTLLTTRTIVPTRRPNQVARPRLIGALNAGLHEGHRLFLVAAPAGFGKTTLIAEWIETPSIQPAWLSLDQDCNEPRSFMNNLLAALRQVDHSFGKATQMLLAKEDRVSVQDLLTSLINDLSAAAPGWLLILDDYHLISDYDIHDLVAALLDKQPPEFSLVIGTREDPPLPLARLRARGQMTEIRERSLRFRREEADQFLNETMMLGLTSSSVRALEKRTEGWAVGLQLAALALTELEDMGQREEFIENFSGDDRFIMDYLMAEVLQRQSQGIKTFLQRTAALDRLTAPLCNAVLAFDETRIQDGEDGHSFTNGAAQEILEHLDRANLFVIALDHRREWYRYHRLFAEFLRASVDPVQQQNTHRRAATWFEENGYPQEALRHRQLAEPARLSSRTLPNQMLVEPLSERELEVLGLIAVGLKNREIGQELTITTGTVKRHTNNIYGKLGVNSRTAAVARARELGFL